MSAKQTITLSLMALISLSGCTGEKPPAVYTFTSLDVTGQFKMADSDLDAAPSAFMTVQATMKNLDALLDPDDLDSDLAKINTYAGSTRMPLAQHTYRLLLLGLEHGEKMDGAYDITSQPLRELWGFGSTAAPAQPPSTELIQATRSAVGPNMLSLVSPSIAFASPETKINVKSLSHGYAVDLSIIQLRREGYESAYVSLANCARCLGTAAADRRWEYSVPHPRPSHDGSIGLLRLPSGLAVATARLYEESVTINGIEYGHIIDPRTGFPAQHMQAVTVVGPTATEATTLAESLIVLNEDAGRSLLVRYPEYEALWIPNRDPMELVMTEGFDTLFTPEPAYSNAMRRLSGRDGASATYK